MADLYNRLQNFIFSEQNQLFLKRQKHEKLILNNIEKITTLINKKDENFSLNNILDIQIQNLITESKLSTSLLTEDIENINIGRREREFVIKQQRDFYQNIQEIILMNTSVDNKHKTRRR